MRVPLVQLVDASGAPYDLLASGDPRTYADLLTPEGLQHIAGYADAVGPNKALVLPHDDAGRLGSPSQLVDDAHAAGLDVHVWTMRDENAFMARNLWNGTDPCDRGNALTEYKALFDAGVDGVFSDHADTALEAREQWLDERRAALSLERTWS